MKTLMIASAAFLLLALAACSGGGKPDAPRTAEPAQPPLPDGIFVTARPAGELRVADAKKQAKTGESIVIRGVVRGMTTAFVPGRAIVQIADEAVPKCPMYPERPWDLHCETADSIAKNTATVQIAGADGRPLKRGLQGVNGLDHMIFVVVKGTVQSADDKGNLVINATEIFVEPRKG